MSTFGKQKGGGRRASSRATAPLTAVLTTLTGFQSVVVVDISVSGAQLRGRSLPDVGEELFLAVCGLDIYGTIAWSRRDACGIEFDKSLCPSDWLLLRQRIAQAQGIPLDAKGAFDDWMAGLAG